MYEDWGKYEEAEPLLRKALTVYEARLGYDNMITAFTMRRLATVLYKLGKLVEARELEGLAQTIHHDLSKGGSK